MPEPGTQATPQARKPTIEGAYVEFMSCAYAMEHEATELYARLAEQLEAKGDGECALFFRQLAEIEDQHARRIRVRMGWTSLPAQPDAFVWGRNPESPYHALELALRCEVQAQEHFEQIARGKAPHRVREAAAEMAAEERTHTKLLEGWLARLTPG